MSCIRRSSSFITAVGLQIASCNKPLLRRCVSRTAPGGTCAEFQTEKAGEIKFRSAPRAAYIHLPFCRQRCGYCSFPVIVQSSRTSEDQRNAAEDAYIDLLLAEIDAACRIATPKGSALRSIYFGGGTPSLTSPRGMDRLIAALDAAFGIESDCEITCEMDPATFASDKAESFARIGINRASVGAQSFHDELLERCGRGHNVDDIYRAVDVLRNANFDNISLDLISGLPKQTKDIWNQSLSSAIKVRPEHISIYDLEIDEGTQFGRLYNPGVLPLPTDEDSADMVEIASEKLQQAGYLRYEISNYAGRDGTQSRHNLSYWNSELFYGFGMGSTSLTTLPSGSVVRYKRPASMSGYRKYAQRLEAIIGQNDVEPECDVSVLNALFPGGNSCTTDDLVEDFVINSFRKLVEGLNLSRMTDDFGQHATENLLRACERSGLCELDLISIDYDRKGNPLRLRLSGKGALFENSVVSTLLHEALWKQKVS